MRVLQGWCRLGRRTQDRQRKHERSVEHEHLNGLLNPHNVMPEAAATQASHNEEVPNPDLLVLLRSLQATQFRDLAGAQFTARVPVAERLINELVALTLPINVPIREARVHPETGDRFSVRLTPK